MEAEITSTVPPFCTGGGFSAMVSWRVQIGVICSCPRMAAEICGYMGI
jgi:hypothetical protein